MKTTPKSIIKLSCVFCLVVLTSCGSGTTNPISKYNGIKAVSASDTKSESQTILKPDLFLITVNGTNQVNAMNFTEGQSSESLVKISPKSDLIQKYSVEIVDFSNAERPVLTATSQNQVYSFVWNPPVGTIPSGTWGKTFQAQLQITVLQASNKLLIGTVETKTIDVIVSRNNVQPKISGHSDLSSGVDENAETAFTVDVIDPSSLTSPRLPEIQVTPYIYANTEAYRADASRYVVYDAKRVNNPEKISDTTWRFYYLLQVDHLPLDRDRLGHEIPSAATVDMCFLMRAVSVIGTFSDQLQICTTARYQVQPPSIIFTEDLPSQVTAGIETIIHAKISTAHALSVISVNKPSTFIANLNGKKEITCDFESVDKKNSQICVIKWTPTCVTATSTMNFTIKADSTLSQKTKSNSVTKEITVMPDLVNCLITKMTVKTPIKTVGGQ